MHIKPVGGTHTELHLNDGTVLLYSYVTPVAARLSDGSSVRTDRQVSSATARRIRIWLHGAPARSVPQSEFDALTA